MNGEEKTFFIIERSETMAENNQICEIPPNKGSKIIVITTTGRTQQRLNLFNNAKPKYQDDSIDCFHYVFKFAELEDVRIGQWYNPKTCHSSK